MIKPPRPPLRRSRAERRVTFALKVLALVALAAVVLSGVVEFLGRIPSVTVIVVGSIFFTYIVHPAVNVLRARGLPLIGAILLTYLGIVAVIAFGLAFVLPALFSDASALVKAAPDYARSAQAWVSDPNDPLVGRLPPEVRDNLAKLPDQAVKFAQDYAGAAASRAIAFVASLVGFVATVVVIPILSIYLMFEAPEIVGALLRALPAKSQPKARAIVADLDKALGGFIRGQLTVGATIGACITIALLVLRVKYAVLIGVAAGLLDIIPYVGAIVGFVPAVTIALFTEGWQHALVVAAVFVLIFQAEGHFIAPRIVSDSVGLTPLMVIVAILIGGELGGIGGMFLAVPIAAVLRVIALHAVPGLRRPEPAPVPVPAAPPPPNPAPPKQAQNART
jgi:predicted PurR-regulated permease PerM